MFVLIEQDITGFDVKVHGPFNSACAAIDAMPLDDENTWRVSQVMPTTTNQFERSSLMMA